MIVTSLRGRALTFCIGIDCRRWVFRLFSISARVQQQRLNANHI